MKNKQIVIEREALYEKVWSTPMSRLASEYGISDVGLAKVCKRMEIPRPPRGYWRQLETGKQPHKVELKPLSKSGAARVNISPPEYKALQSSSTRTPDKIIVPESLQEPHSLVSKTLTALRKGKPSEKGIILPRNKICLDIKVTRDSIDRACLLMDTLVKALNERGYLTEVTREVPTKTIVTVDDERLEVGIDEKLISNPHIASPNDKKKYGPYSWNIPKFDYSPSGLLSLKIRDIPYYGIRHQWGDGKVQRIENHLSDFIAGLELAAKVREERRIERARQKEEWEREWQRREELRRLAEIEQEKIDKLQTDVANWALANRVDAYLDHLEKMTHPIEGLSEWISWGRRYAKQINPLEHHEDLIYDGIESRRGNIDWKI